MTGAELATLRLRLSLTQRALAEFLEVTTTTVSRWERNERKVPGWVPRLLNTKGN